MPTTLDQLINKFENDTDWNTTNRDGSKRFDEEIKWIKLMIQKYAKALSMNPDDVANNFEKNRDYSWPNYYQPGNFPDIEVSDKLIIFNTIEDFESAKLNYECPQCKSVSEHAQECIHRINNDGECDWCADGLFTSPYKLIVKEHSLVPVAIFKVVEN